MSHGATPRESRDDEGRTPALAAFRKWWADNGNRFSAQSDGVQAEQKAWCCFRDAWYAANETVSESAPSDDELRAALIAYEGALSESDNDGDDSQTQDARDKLLNVMRRLRGAASRSMVAPSDPAMQEALTLAEKYRDEKPLQPFDMLDTHILARAVLRLSGRPLP